MAVERPSKKRGGGRSEGVKGRETSTNVLEEKRALFGQEKVYRTIGKIKEG